MRTSRSRFVPSAVGEKNQVGKPDLGPSCPAWCSNGVPWGRSGARCWPGTSQVTLACLEKKPSNPLACPRRGRYTSHQPLITHRPRIVSLKREENDRVLLACPTAIRVHAPGIAGGDCDHRGPHRPPASRC